jgi:hypothetical protein
MTRAHICIARQRSAGRGHENDISICESAPAERPSTSPNFRRTTRLLKNGGPRAGDSGGGSDEDLAENVAAKKASSRLGSATRFVIPDGVLRRAGVEHRSACTRTAAAA